MLPVPERSDAATTWKRWLLGMSSGSRMQLYEEIASLVTAGIGIREALADLANRSWGRRRNALVRVADAVAHGLPVGEALVGMPEHFAPVEARLVAAGEKTGRLDRAFREAAAEVVRARKVRDRFVKSVAYPLFLLHFALFVPTFVILTVRNSFAEASVVVWGIFLLFWGTIAALTTLHLSRRHTAAWGRTVATLPLVGPAVRSAALARAARVTAALHDAGEDLATTFRHAADVSGNGWIAGDFRTAADRVTQGVPVTAALVAVGAFESDARSLIETGEQSGTLSESFRHIAEREDERFRDASVRVAVALGAVIFTIVVLWVVGLVFQVYVKPMRDLMKQL